MVRYSNVVLLLLGAHLHVFGHLGAGDLCRGRGGADGLRNDPKPWLPEEPDPDPDPDSV